MYPFWVHVRLLICPVTSMTFYLSSLIHDVCFLCRHLFSILELAAAREFFPPINERDLLNFVEVCDVIAQTAARATRNGLWYINDYLTFLVLFSGNVSANEKTVIVAAFGRPAKNNDLERVETCKEQ